MAWVDPPGESDGRARRVEGGDERPGLGQLDTADPHAAEQPREEVGGGVVHLRVVIHQGETPARPGSAEQSAELVGIAGGDRVAKSTAVSEEMPASVAGGSVSPLPNTVGVLPHGVAAVQEADGPVPQLPDAVGLSAPCGGDIDLVMAEHRENGTCVDLPAVRPGTAGGK